jgi:ABC-2 type transport system ATP-binding protein
MIEASGLTKRYGTKLAVDGLTFVVPDGRVTGFLGPNGAGKSTTMRMIVGLDTPTSGILWVRHLLRSLAAEGRTVFVSSHLMNEMALTADYLIVIGQGRLIATGSVSDVIRQSSASHVRVVSPQADQLRTLVEARGGRAEPDGAERLAVTGLECRDVGILAAGAGLILYELSPQQASLEAAFMEMTRDSAEFLGSAVTPEGSRT